MDEIATPTTNAGYNADWASPTGDLIEEVLEERGWTASSWPSGSISAPST